MMHDFLASNQEELAARCRDKVRGRVGRAATERQLNEGIPLFLDQLIRTLSVEHSDSQGDTRSISGPAGGNPAHSEVSVSAARHGRNLLALGLTVDQVVHDYGDLCQAITDLAVERNVPFQVNEFRTLNRCLDNAISDAVTEFSYQRDAVAVETNTSESNKQMALLAQELRNLLGTASLAFSAAKAGQLNLSGATGTILERSLNGLERLISKSVDDTRRLGVDAIDLAVYSLADFIDEIYAAAALTARSYGCTLRAAQVAPELALEGGRDVLISAVANLLHNGFQFTKPGTEVMLSAYASGARILIDVRDHCGGLRNGEAESMFRTLSGPDDSKTGAGLGLAIAKQTVTAYGGTLTVANIAGDGCVFTISLPRKKVLT